MSSSIKGAFTLTGQIKGRDGVPPLELSWTIDNPTPSTNDFFGNSVSISSTHAIIGAYNENTGVGRAYIYDLASQTLLHSLNNPTPSAGDWFGRSVAIDGNYAIVGERLDDNGATQAGSAYIFDVTTGNLLHTINNPTPTQAEYFGTVDISGSYAIIGAPGNRDSGFYTGGAYIYNVTTGSLVHTLLNPTPTDNEWFGDSVAIDGNYAVVGSHGENTNGSSAGAAYIYNVGTGNLIHTLYSPTPAISNQFGWSVSISGNYVVVGELQGDTQGSNVGSAYVYDVITGNLLHTLTDPNPTATGQFGFSVSVSGDTVVVGAVLEDTGADNSGSAYVFSASSGNLLATINNPAPGLNDRFGTSVSTNGNEIIIGALNNVVGSANNAGSAYIYN